MNLSIFGLGYVGTVIAGCFAKAGHRVLGVDMDEAKVKLINSGHSPIIEAEMDEMIRDAVACGALRATLDVDSAVRESEISLICVGTPSRGNGELELHFIQRVCDEIGCVLRAKSARHLVVVRSTVLPGTIENIVIPALEAASGKRAGAGFGIVMNPEFMRESTAVRDFYNPPKTVIGSDSAEDAATVARLYEGLPGPLIHTGVKVAEMVKYCDNIFHALKITFGNEVGLIAKAVGVDSHEVMRIFCQDTKLNLSPAYLKPGFAYGGSCLPKDLRAMTWLARSREVEAPMLAAIGESNERQIKNAIRILFASGKKKIGVLGFAFKGGTDDLRESPIVTVVEALLGKGCELRLFDPCVNTARLVGANRRYIEERIPHLARLMVASAEEAVVDAEIIVLGNGNEAYLPAIRSLGPSQRVMDFTNSSTRPETAAHYERLAG